MQDPNLCVVHFLITLGGVLLNFELAGAGADECEIVMAILCDHTTLRIIGDKGDIRQAKARLKGIRFWRHKRTHVRTLAKRN